MSDLTLLTSVLSGYASKWNLIGIALGFTPKEISNIRSKPALFETAPKGYLVELLNEWVHWPNEAHDVLPTVEALETALKGQLVGLGSVSETLRTLLLQQKTSNHLLKQPLVRSLPECVEKYAKFMKSKYHCALPLMPPGEWPPNRGRQYSDLTIVEKVRDSLPDQKSVNKRIKAMSRGQVKRLCEDDRVIKSLNDVLAQDSNTPIKLLVEGIPGAGKSTLVRKSCKDWADDQSLQQFDLVLLVTLKNQEIRKAEVVEELLEADDPHLKKKVTEQLQETSGEGVLFILDGYDELNEEEQPFFRKLIQGELLHKCSIILTSRSYAVEDLKYEEWIHRHVEILGFTEQQMEIYFLQNVTDRSVANALAKSLREETSLSSISYTPLNCSILLYFFQQGKFKLPSTLTELFEVFVLSLIKHHLRKLMSFSKALPTCLSSLPKPICNQFSALCKLAYNGLNEGKFKFSPQDITEVYQGTFKGEIHMEANLLSLMVSTTSFSSFGEETHYQFLHGTVQEFLAAKWIAQQSVKEQKRFLTMNWMLPRMRSRLVFYAGITKLKGELFEDLFASMSSSSHVHNILKYQTQRNVLPERKQNDSTPPENASSILSIYPESQRIIQHSMPPEQDPYKSPIYPECQRIIQHSMPPEQDPYRPARYPESQRIIQHSMQDPYRDPKHLCSIKEPANVPAGTEAFMNIVCMLSEAQNNSLCNLVFQMESELHSITLASNTLVPAHQSFSSSWSTMPQMPPESLVCSLRKIEVGYCKLTALECSAIASFLSKSPHPLKSIKFNFCNLTKRSVEIFHKISTSGSCTLKECNKCHLNYCAPSFSSALSLLPQVPWFQHTKVLHLHGLRYPKGLLPDKFHLSSLLNMRNIKALSVTVEHIPVEHLHDYETVFLKFVEVLHTNKTLKRFRYTQSPSAATCESFVQLMSALSHNTGLLLEIGHTKVITMESVTIPDDVCFKICSRGLARAMELAGARGIKLFQVNQQFILLPCKSCQTIMKSKTAFTECKSTCYPTELFNIDDNSRPLSDFECIQSEAPARIRLIITGLTQMPCTKVLHLHGLQYPKGLLPDKFDLSSILNLKNIEELSVTVEQIPMEHLHDYETVFLKFVEVLHTIKTLTSFSYNQSPSAATCESFVQLMSALSHNTRVSLEIGHTKVITTESVIIPDGICFKVCSRGLARAMELAYTRGSKRLQVHQKNIFLPCKSCQISIESRTTFVECENMCYSAEMSINDNSRSLADLECIQSEDPARIRLITTGLTSSKNLQSFDIDISGCQVTDEVAQCIAAGLAGNRTLKEITLNPHHLTSKGIGYILKSVNQDKTVDRLDIKCEVKKVPYSLEVTSIPSTSDHRTAMTDCFSTIIMVFNHFTSESATIKIVVEALFDMEESIPHNVMCMSEDVMISGETLRNHQVMRRLDFSRCKIDDEVAAHIATGLAKNHSLKILNLSKNHITSTGAVHMFKSLESVTSLKELDLSWNKLQLHQTDVKSEAGESLGVKKMLTANQALRRLDLIDCDLDDEVAAHIATGLAKNHSLKILNLSWNHITGTGAVKIFKSLENNTSLEELDLSWNNFQPHQTSIKSEAGESLGVTKMLTVNQTLRRLDLRCCGLDYATAAALQSTIVVTQ